MTKLYVNNTSRLQKHPCRLRTAGWLLLLIVLLGSRQSFGQRVYANTTQYSPTQQLLLITLSQVINPNGAVGSNQNDSSNLSVTVGLNLLNVLKIGTAYQNLQFTGTNTPSSNSPVYFKVTGNGGAVLSLLNNFSVQRTIGGANNFVGNSYTASSLLSLLGLFAGGNQTYMFVPPDNNPQSFDGVQLTLNANGLSLGVFANAYVYFSFFITSPKISGDIDTVCENAISDSLTLSLDNTIDPGITYYLFKDTTGLNYSPGSALNTTINGYVGTFSNNQKTIYNPFISLLAVASPIAAPSQDFSQNFYIIAQDLSESPKFFYSGWKKITYKRTIQPSPGQASVTIN